VFGDERSGGWTLGMDARKLPARSGLSVIGGKEVAMRSVINAAIAIVGLVVLLVLGLVGHRPIR
jgi:hypothetical protein